MTSPSPAFLKFACPQCGKRLKALPEQGGHEFACPQCSHHFVAPTIEEAIGEETGYHFSGSRAAEKVAQEEYVYTNCPLCGSSIASPISQLGKRTKCPDCHSDVTVVSDPKPKPFVSQVKPPASDEYRLADEGAPPVGVTAPKPQERHFSISCPKCHSVLRAAMRHVGKRLPCPDCGTAILVAEPPPERTAKPAATLDDAIDFKLSEEFERPKVMPLADVVKESKPKRAAGTPSSGPSGIAASPAATALAPAKPAKAREADPALKPRKRDEEDEDAARKRRRESRKLPNEPFFKNLLVFFKYPDVWIRWIAFSAAASVSMMLFVFTLTIPGGGPMMMAAMMIHRVNVVITAVWSVYLFINCLSIAQDTAEGEDEITGWAEVSILDSMWEGVWAISAILFSGLPVGLLLTLLGVPWPIASPLVVLSMFFFFPLVILSMFAEESPMMPFSADVWRGPFQHTPAWIKFYIAAGVLAAASLVGIGIATAAGLLWTESLYGVLPVLAAIFVAGQMVYFRLLGRVARLGVSEPERRKDEDED